MSGHTEWSEIRRDSKLPVYTVTAERDGTFWFLRVRELPGLFSQVRRLDLAEEWIRDAIALWLEVAPDSFEVRVEPVLEGEVGHYVRTALALRNRSAAFVQGSNLYTGGVVRHLVRDEQMTVRDVGRLLGLSFQRVQQLAHEERVGVNLADIERDLAGQEAETSA